MRAVRSLLAGMLADRLVWIALRLVLASHAIYRRIGETTNADRLKRAIQAGVEAE